MKKGAKKRTRQDEEANTAEDNGKQSSKTTSRAKRVKASKPESDPEYFEDKRNLVHSTSSLFLS